MVAVTYGVARVPVAGSDERAQAAAPHKGLFARFLQRVMESRMEHARREIAKHAHLMPPDQRHEWLTKTHDEMPTGGW
jgi:hypothetical protein